MLMHSHSFANPPVFVTESDYEVLSPLAEQSCAAGAALLRHELARAICLKDGESPSRFVRLHSTVDYTDLTSRRHRTVKLVEPRAADMAANRLSVLAPAGAALLGLRTGDMFSWWDRGRSHALAVNRLIVDGR